MICKVGGSMFGIEMRFDCAAIAAPLSENAAYSRMRTSGK